MTTFPHKILNAYLIFIFVTKKSVINDINVLKYTTIFFSFITENMEILSKLLF